MSTIELNSADVVILKHQERISWYQIVINNFKGLKKFKIFSPLTKCGNEIYHSNSKDECINYCEKNKLVYVEDEI